MRIYLVDFENVKSKGLEGIDKLDETDSVIIFYSENSDTISFEMHQRVLTSKADVEYFKVNVGGKNALDFQLSTLLGFLVAKEQYSHIFIISNDRGFDFLHDFWNGNYVDAPSTFVYRTKTISMAIAMTHEDTINVLPEDNNDDEKCDEIAAAVEIVDTAENVVSEPETTEANETPQQVVEKKEPPVRRTRKNVRVKLTFKETLDSLLDDKCEQADKDRIGTLLSQSETKEEFHNLLAKAYKQQGTDFYKVLKTHYIRIKRLLASEAGSTENQSEKAVTSKNDTTETSNNIQVENLLAQADELPTEAKETNIVYEKLSELLCGICGDEDIATIYDCLTQANTKQQLYIRMIKAFHKEKGCEYYNAIRSEYTSLAKIKEGV